MSFCVHGLGVSDGVAIGLAHVIQHAELRIDEYTISPERLSFEVERLYEAVQQAKDALRALKAQIPTNTATDIAAFIDTHLLMLEDAAFTADAERLIREHGCNAEWALKLQRDALVKVFDEMDDPYLRTRIDDVDHVVTRIQRILLNHAPLRHELPGNRLEGMVVLADDLSPADTILMQRNGVAAFVTAHGGPTSHTSILARSLGIPGIVGAHGVRRFVNDNELLVVDGTAGVVLGNPDPVSLTYYREQQAARARRVESLAGLKSQAAATLDGIGVELLANAELPSDFVAAREVGASGVGLYRTEFLFMNRADYPDETEHFETYRELIAALDGMPVTIRTIDLGADKEFDPAAERGVALNPALGLRAIRLALTERSLYWPQLRAIVRASAFGPVRLMIPMLSALQEARQVVGDIRALQDEFDRTGVSYDPDMQIGGMIEVPAAAICADSFVRYLDFLSIGTNDLIQYTIAIDRVNDAVSYLYDPLHPAVLRLIASTIDAGSKVGIPVAMCGEMAGDAKYTRLLLGLGLRQFSVHPAGVLEVKSVINQTRISDIEATARRALHVVDPEELRELLRKLA